MDIVAIENTLQSILKPELGVSFFGPTNQNMPEDTLTYATYNLLTINDLGKVQRGNLDIDGIRTNYKHYELIFQIMVYGQNAVRILQELDRSLEKETVLEAFYDADLAYANSTAVRRTPEVISSRWEERAQMNVTFRTFDEYTDDVGYVESATIDGEFYDVDESLVLTNTIDVNLT